MAFWDFLAKLLGAPRPPAASPPTPPTFTTSPPVIPAPPGVDVTPVVTVTSPPSPPPVAASPPPTPAPEAPPPGSKPGDFLPIGRNDLLKQGEDVRRASGWMWFGRRDIIPPVSDPRTLLIDRGMLTQGFL